MEAKCKLCGRIEDGACEPDMGDRRCERCGGELTVIGDGGFVPSAQRILAVEVVAVAVAVAAFEVDVEDDSLREDRHRDLEVLVRRSRLSLLPPPPLGFNAADDVVDVPESVRTIVRLALHDSVLPTLPTAPQAERPKVVPASATAPVPPPRLPARLRRPVVAARRRTMAASGIALLLGIAGGLVGFVGLGPRHPADHAQRFEAALEEAHASPAIAEPAEPTPAIAINEPPAAILQAPPVSTAAAASEPVPPAEPPVAPKPPPAAPRPVAVARVSGSGDAPPEPRPPRITAAPTPTPTSTPSVAAAEPTRPSPEERPPVVPVDNASAPNLLDAITDAVGKGGTAAAPKAPSADEVALQPFDRGGAQAALEGIAASVAQCRGEGIEGGRSGVSVTFAPSGSASGVRVDDGPFAGTPAGRCLVRLFNGAKVRPFSGAAITVHRSFLLN
jgi:hypothetical protein